MARFKAVHRIGTVTPKAYLNKWLSDGERGLPAIPIGKVLEENGSLRDATTKEYWQQVADEKRRKRHGYHF